MKVNLWSCAVLLVPMLSFVNAPLRAEESDEALWKKLDLTEDGWLDGKELDGGAGGWLKFDANGNKEVTKAEFLAGRAKERGATSTPSSTKAAKKPSAEEATQVFKKLDLTGNGYLTGAELNGENARAYDANKDNVVELAEFIAGYTGQKAAPAQTSATPTDKQAPKTANPASTNSPIAETIVQPPAAQMVQGKPVGLFYMQKYWFATRYLEKACWYFAPDGKVYENLITGFSPQNLAAHKGGKGTYKVEGNEMEVTWSDGQTSKAELEIVPGGFNWDTGMYAPVEPFAPNKPLTGTYEGGTSLGEGGNYAAISKTLQLNADGTYALSGISTVKSTSEGTTASAGGQSEAGGRWQLKGYTMILTDNNGASTAYMAFPFDDEKTPIYPDRIFVGGTMYKKK